MYHLKNDKRTQISAMMIYDGLCSLIGDGQDFTSIKVVDIQKISSVSRSTFYRLFDSILDVFMWKGDVIHQEAFTECQSAITSGKSRNACLEAYFSTWHKHLDFVKICIKSNNLDVIFTSFINNYSILNSVFANTFKEGKEQELFISLRAHVAIQTLLFWVENASTKSHKEIADLVAQNLNFAVKNSVIF